MSCSGTSERDRRIETLHEEFFATVQDWTVITSLVVLGTWFAFGRHWSGRSVGLTTIIETVVIANAAVTGIMSNVEDRYQAALSGPCRCWLVCALWSGSITRHPASAGGCARGELSFILYCPH